MAKASISNNENINSNGENISVMKIIEISGGEKQRFSAPLQLANER
jgi:hypothetical protein